MTPQIDFEKPLKATTTDGGTVNFVINEKIPGQPEDRYGAPGNFRGVRHSAARLGN